MKLGDIEFDGSTKALFHFDETSGTSASDDSGNNNTATITNGSFVTGNLNNSLSLNGDTSSVSVPDSSSLSLSQNNTLEAWTKFSSSFMNIVLHTFIKCCDLVFLTTVSPSWVDIRMPKLT